jgi:GT2 family glycosyltransferase
MSEPSVAIIILNWNGKDDTLECLKSLESVIYSNYRTILVDNGSTDGSVQAIREAFPDVQLIETGKNLGFAAGNNVGIKVALDEGFDAILLLNNDTTIDPQFLTVLVIELCQSPDIGATNSAIYYYDEPQMIWSAGGTIDWKTGISYQRHINETDHRQLERADVDYGVGASILMRREAVLSVGMLDPDFFLYYEETDWCCRARDAGFSTVLAPRSKIYHKVSRSMEGRSCTQLYYFTRNRLHFLKKRGWGRSKLLRLAIFHFGRMALAKVLRGDIKSARTVVRAVSDFYRGRMGRLR